MTTIVSPQAVSAQAVVLPKNRGAYYGGAWYEPKAGRYADTINPGTGQSLGKVAASGADDIDAAVASAKAAFNEWRRVLPLERARILRRIAEILRQNANELAMIDAADCGNPVKEMVSEAMIAAAQVEFFAGFVTEMKGSSIPMGPDVVNFSVREPLGVVGRIIPFNHPFMFCAGGLLPAGAFNVVPGGREAGQRLASNPDVAMIALIGSVPTGRAVMKAASDTVKRTMLELGGKNALIAFGDADPDDVAAAVIGGMNFTWCGQSCGSTSRAFIHEKIYDAVIARVKDKINYYKPGVPTDPATTMGAIVSKQQFERVMSFIDSAKSEGAQLITGGGPPSDPALKNGFYIEPTVFAVTEKNRIAREEIFGPVLGVFKWNDEAKMLETVNAVEYGLTASIWTNDLNKAHRTAMGVNVGYVWINEVSKHFLGAPFGGFKQSGLGREECFEEMLSFTQEKNIHLKLKSAKS